MRVKSTYFVPIGQLAKMDDRFGPENVHADVGNWPDEYVGLRGWIVEKVKETFPRER